METLAQVLHDAAAFSRSSSSGSNPGGEHQWVSLQKLREVAGALKGDRMVNTPRALSKQGSHLFLRDSFCSSFLVSSFVFQVASLEAQDGFHSDQGFRCFAQIQRLKNKLLSFDLIGPPLNQSPWPGDWHMLIGFEWQFSETVTLIGGGQVTVIG